MNTTMIPLQDYRDHTEFHPVDWSFGDLLARHADTNGDDHQEAIALLGAMTLAAVRQEHSCLDLQAWRQRPRLDDDTSPLPSPFTPEEWLERLRQQPRIASEDLNRRTPLVFVPDLKLVYLHKYRQYEKTIADFIRHRLPATACPPPLSPETVHGANDFFANSNLNDDPQQQAAALAVNRRFAIITGGPGTGKTTVLATILALELERNPDLRIGLAAPTGKAAARMTAAITEELAAKRLHINDTTTATMATLKAKTIHALIGASAPGRKPRFQHDNPLECDLAVIDEASMASLPLMARMMDALPQDGRLLLIGDKDQLTSVEAGSVLADLCINPELQTHLVRLTKNHRSAANTALCSFVETIAAGEPTPDLTGLYSGQHPHFLATPLPTIGQGRSRHDALKQALTTALNDLLTDGFSLEEWQRLPSLQRAFEYHENLKILAGLRDGPFGVINLNRLMAEILDLPLYANGAPVMVLANDYVTDLRNGDVGICWNG